MMKKQIWLPAIFFILFGFSNLCSQNLDIELLRNINGNQSEFLRNSSIAVSNTTTYVGASVPIVLGVTALITKDEDMLKNALAVGISLGVTTLATTGIKYAVGRPRPYITYPDIVSYEDISSRSFPSGHTSYAFAAATSLSLKYPKWYIIAPSYLWACSVGYSRMNLGVHYPTDVLAGAILGAGSAYLSCKINDWLYGKIQPVKILKLDGYFL